MTTIEFLNKEDRDVLIYGVFGKYLHGKCYEFAFALHEGLSLPLFGVDVDGKIIHVGVMSQANLYRDVRGDLDLAGFLQGFDVSSGFVIRPTTTKELGLMYEEINNQKFARELINRARSHAELLWPMWSWKDSQTKRMEDFSNDLEKLCQKHGVWIREQFPANPTVAYFGDEAEAGYDLKQIQAARLQFLVTRRFN